MGILGVVGGQWPKHRKTLVAGVHRSEDTEARPPPVRQDRGVADSPDPHPKDRGQRTGPRVREAETGPRERVTPGAGPQENSARKKDRGKSDLPGDGISCMHIRLSTRAENVARRGRARLFFLSFAPPSYDILSPERRRQRLCAKYSVDSQLFCPRAQLVPLYS